MRFHMLPNVRPIPGHQKYVESRLLFLAVFSLFLDHGFKYFSGPGRAFM